MRKVSRLFKLPKLAYLIGLLHDMGKYTELFYEYITGNTIQKGEVKHSSIGAFYAFKNWYNPDDGDSEKYTAQIISMTIFAHHSGFLDIFDLK